MSPVFYGVFQKQPDSIIAISGLHGAILINATFRSFCTTSYSGGLAKLVCPRTGLSPRTRPSSGIGVVARGDCLGLSFASSLRYLAIGDCAMLCYVPHPAFAHLFLSVSRPRVSEISLSCLSFGITQCSPLAQEISLRTIHPLPRKYLLSQYQRGSGG